MRLTQRMNDGCDTICENCPMKGKCSDSQDCVNVLTERLCAYEDAEEQGLLVRLPCKVGTTVYIVTCCGCVYMYQDRDYFTGTGEVICPYEDDCDIENCDNRNVRVFEDTFTRYLIDENGIHYCFNHVNGWLFEEDCFGKTVFLSRKEAEAVLKTELPKEET